MMDEWQKIRTLIRMCRPAVIVILRAMDHYLGLDSFKKD